MSIITGVWGRQILDSRGNPTVEVEIEVESGFLGKAAVPAGASTGKREALELRDKKHEWLGKGVDNAVNNINEHIAPAILELESTDQRGIDLLLLALDGTENKSKLGANSILAVSMAVARVSAMELGIPLYQYLGGVGAHILPIPFMNIINGGAHATNNLDIQEFMIVPAGFPTYRSALRAGSEIYHNLKKTLVERNLAGGVGDEGGFAPELENNEEALTLIVEAIKRAGYEFGKEIFLALDVAASEFFDNDKYDFESSLRTSEDMIDYYEELVSKFPIISIEDGLAEDDWDGWEKLTARLGNSLQLVGDDIFVTNPQIIAEGIRLKIANSVLIKLNQIGSVTETLEAVEMAHRVGWNTIISHRSGETSDTFIADLAVAVNSGQIKAGAPCRSERVAKYNQLLRIEEEMGEAGNFANKNQLYPWIA